MDRFESIFFWLTCIFYIISFVLLLVGLIFKKTGLINPLRSLRFFGTERETPTILGFLFHTLTIITRWIATGHLPVMRNYENVLAGSWLIILFFILLQKKFKNIIKSGSFIIPFCVLMLGYGLMSNPELESLTPPHQSGWLYVHVIFAWLAYSSYVVSTALAITYLVKSKKSVVAQCFTGHSEPEAKNLVQDRFIEQLDDLSFKLIAFGFIMHAVMLVSGSIWASRLWGSYWNWDPVETWSLVSWIVYGIYLHLRLGFKWKGEKSAYLAIIALVFVIISFWGINYVQSMHIFRLI